MLQLVVCIEEEDIAPLAHRGTDSFYLEYASVLPMYNSGFFESGPKARYDGKCVVRGVVIDENYFKIFAGLFLSRDSIVRLIESRAL